MLYTVLFLLVATLFFTLLGSFFLSLLLGWATIGVFFKWVTPFSSKGLQPILKTAQVIFLEPLALLGVYAFSFLSFWKKPSLSKNSKTPILMVHGYVNFSSVWIYHRVRLWKMGYGPIYTINLGYPFHSIESYAKKVKDKAKEIEKQTKKQELILIGHSMGGLVSTVYTVKYGKDKVKAIITLASPLRGTKMANLGIGECAKQMRTHSSFIKNLKRKLPIDLYYHVATRKDQLVVPYRSSLVNDKRERRYVLDDLGHASLLYSKRVSVQIGKWLKQIN